MKGKRSASAGFRLLLGTHAVVEAIRARSRITQVFLSSPPTPGAKTVAAVAEQHGVPVRKASPQELERIVERHSAETGAALLPHQGVVALAKPLDLCSLEQLLQQPRPSPLFLCLDQITDPHNLGALVRTGVALGIDGIVLPKRRSASITETVSRASAGAIEHAKVAIVTNLSQSLLELRKHDVECLGLCANGETPLSDLAKPNPSGRAIVVGSEGAGLRRLVRERCSGTVRIDMPGPIESLNASVAGSIALFVANHGRSAMLG